MTSKCRSSPAVGLSVQLSVMQTAGCGLNPKYTGTFLFNFFGIYIRIYTEQNYKRNTFVFAPIFHELNSMI